jgi:hypothetical protein
MMRTILLAVLIFSGTINLGAQPLSIRESRSKPMGTEVTLTGIVTCDVIGNPSIRYFQDPTGGMAVYDHFFADDVKMGDSVTITGVLKDYENLIELDPVRGYTIHSGGHNLPHPLVIKPGQLHDSIQGMLVQINHAVFEDAGATFSPGTYHYIADNEPGIIYVHPNNALSGEPVPSGPVTMTGIASTYYENHQVLVRHPDDLVRSSTIWLTGPPTVSNITTQGFDLEWTTNIKGSTKLKYGNTPGMKLGVLTGTADSAWHLVPVNGAAPSELFYAQALSVAGEDTARSTVNAYITKSNSTGVIKAYFNRTVDHSVSSGKDAVELHLGMDDTLAACINRAKYSIDLAIYSYNTNGITDITAALNAAHDRGVRVRIVADWNTGEQKGWDNLDPDIGIMLSPEEDYNANIGIMHNKFLIIDAVSPDPADSYVWTGSGNITEDQLHYHANNVIIIQDQSLARVYQLEFEEMFGGSGSQPDAAASRFGTSKKDNTPHDLVIGNIPVECYFSPTDRVGHIIGTNIGKADHELYVNTLLITRDFLAEAIVERKNSGVITKVIVNDENDPADNEYVMGLLKDLGQNFRQNGEGSMLHHKTMIIDQGYPDSDPMVLTGSHNWSSSADNRNDENILIIHDETVANIYFQEFSERFSHGEIIGNTSIYVTGLVDRPQLFIYPNPNAGRFILISPFLMEVQADLEIYSGDGRLIWSVRTRLVPGENPVILPSKPESGLYILQLRHQGGTKQSLFISE